MSEDPKPFDLDKEPEPYRPMHEATPEHQAKPTYDARNIDDMKEAAAEVTKAREQATPRPAPGANEDGIVERSYKWVGGPKDGEAIPENETISVKRAAEDVLRVRQMEAAAVQPDIAKTADAARAAYNGQPQPVEAQPQPAQPQQPQQPQPPQPAERLEDIPDVDPEITAALENPKVRALLEQEIAQTEKARAAFAESARQTSQVAVAGFFSSFPEMMNVPVDQVQTAIQVIGARDPARAQAINAHLERTHSLVKLSQQAAAQQQQLAAQQEQAEVKRVQEWVASEDARFDKEVAASESPEMMKKIEQNLVQIITEDYGMSKADLVQAWQTQPIMHSLPFQKMLLDAGKYRLAQRDVASKVHRGIPNVQRPGTASAHFNNSAVDDALKAFRDQPTARSAAALVMARRAAKQ